MKRKYFGTDGVRGKVGVFPITPDFVMRLNRQQVVCFQKAMAAVLL